MLVSNKTPFFCATKLTSLRPPEPQMTLVVRGTFRIVKDGVLEPIEGLDQGFLNSETYAEGDAELPEALTPSDFADFKLNAEVFLAGSCHAPGGKAVGQCPVRFSVGKWKKELAVFGDRRWDRGLTGGSASEPTPFKKIPLDFAHAFGGPDYAANPAGKGYKSDALPNVEVVEHLVTSKGQEPPPASYGPISPAWSERAQKRGKNYGRSYLKERAPFVSDDFDWTFHSAAPKDQQLEGYLRGDEEVKLVNLCPGEPFVTTRLPGLRVRAFVKDRTAAFREIPMSLDTLFAEPDAMTVKLSWRGVANVREDDLADVQTLLVVTEPLGEAQKLDRYREDLEAFEKDPTGVLAALPKELVEAFERSEKERRGEPVEPFPVDPKLDPLSRIVKEKFGPLASDEAMSAIGTAVAALDAAPEGAKPDLEKLVSEAKARQGETPPQMRVIKPGRLPDPGLRAQMRMVMAETEKLREAEKLTGKPVKGIAELEAFPRDPQWKKLDPEYEPPGPLSTDEPGPNADLAERDFSGQDFTGRDLRGANFERANLTRAKLAGADLSGAKLGRAVLYLADLGGANLERADLTLANAAFVKASKATFTGATMTEAFLEGANLSFAKLDGARLGYAVLEGANLSGASAIGAELDHADVSKANLANAKLEGATATFALFANANAKGADFSKTSLRQASFVEADLAGARFVSAKAPKAFFMKARLDGAEFGYADLTEAHLTEASAVGARFYGANLREARLYRTDLERAEIVRANLTSVDARKAHLEKAKLIGSNLYDAKLLEFRGTGFDLTEANLKRAVMKPA